MGMRTLMIKQDHSFQIMCRKAMKFKEFLSFRGLARCKY